MGRSSGQFIGYTTDTHNFRTNESLYISGLSTSGIPNNSEVVVGVITDTFKLDTAISASSATGIATYLNLTGYLRYPHIVENDILGIGTESVKVLNVDSDLSRVRVLREHNSTVGTAHTANSLVSQKLRKFNFNASSKIENSKLNLNRELYFNPKEAIGLGTISGVGIGSTLSFSNPGTGISEIFIPTKALYFKEHGLNTGDILTYSTNTGAGISVSTDGIDGFALTQNQTVYAAKLTNDLIGIATARVGLGSTGTFVGIDSTTTALSLIHI